MEEKKIPLRKTKPVKVREVQEAEFFVQQAEFFRDLRRPDADPFCRPESPPP